MSALKPSPALPNDEPQFLFDGRCHRVVRAFGGGTHTDLPRTASVTDVKAIVWRLAERLTVLDERGRRLWAAAEARSAGRGGMAAVVRATGISESTVLRGLADLDSGERLAPGKVRRHPGRKPILEREPGLAKDLDRLIDPATRGDPESPLRWTSKSAVKLAGALRELGHDVVDRTVLRLLKADGSRC